MLGHARFGSSHDDPVVAVVSPRGPDLLAADDPLVAVPNSLCGQPSHIRPGTWLRKHLAPDRPPADVVGHKVGTLCVTSELVEHRQAHSVRDGQREVGQAPSRCQLIKAVLVFPRQAGPAEVAGVGEPGQACSREICLEPPRSVSLVSRIDRSRFTPLAAVGL